MVQSFWKIARQFLAMLNVVSLHDPAIILVSDDLKIIFAKLKKPI